MSAERISKMNEKLDEILAKTTKMFLKITKIEKHMVIFETRLAKVDTKLIEAKLKTKATVNDFNFLHDKTPELERKLEANENKNLQKKFHSKRINLLVHGLEETNAWKTKNK